MAHPEIGHGKARVAFGPDEEIGRGVDCLDVAHLAVISPIPWMCGPVGELQYESFNAVNSFHGKNIHPGTAKGKT